MNRYKIVDTFVVRDAQVIVLDHPWEFGHIDNMELVSEGKVYHFVLPHNQNWLIIRTDDDLKGKTVYIR